MGRELHSQEIKLKPQFVQARKYKDTLHVKGPLTKSANNVGI